MQPFAGPGIHRITTVRLMSRCMPSPETAPKPCCLRCVSAPMLDLSDCPVRSGRPESLTPLTHNPPPTHETPRLNAILHPAQAMQVGRTFIVVLSDKTKTTSATGGETGPLYVRLSAVCACRKAAIASHLGGQATSRCEWSGSLSHILTMPLTFVAVFWRYPRMLTIALQRNDISWPG